MGGMGRFMINVRTRKTGAGPVLHATISAIALVIASHSPALARQSAAAPPPADNSGFDDGEQGIVVTARRRVETAQDVPVALSVVSAETIERTGNFTLGQMQQLVPSLQVQGTNARNTSVNIRGLGANSAAAVDGLEYGVGFYVDGVYYGRPGQSQFDLVDIAQIEVLRGPQGTLFGKNTTAGALNLTTREPSFTPEAVVEGWLGNYGFHQLRGSVSLPVIDDTVALRVSIADTHRDGFLTNVYDGSDAQDYDNFTGRAQLLITPSESVRIRLIGDYSKQKQHISLTLIDDYFTQYANGARIANNVIDRAERTGLALPTTDAFAREGNSNSPFQADMESYGASGQVDWDLGSATITSITAYRWWDWYPRNDIDGTPLSVNLTAHSNNFQRQFSQELRIASDGGNTVDYVAGLYYFWQVIRAEGEFSYGKDYAAWNLNPATASPARIAATDYAMNGFEADWFSDPRTKSYAAFGQADWHITDALTLTGGLRYTHEDKKGGFSQTWVAGNDLSVLSGQALIDARAARNAVNPEFGFSAKLKSDAVSGLITASYKVDDDAMLYASYSHGSKSGGLNLTAGGAARPVVNPEKVDAYEIGLKSQFFNRQLTVNAAAFLTDVSDFQANITEPVVGTNNVIQYIANIPKVRSKGVEADISFAPSRWFSLSASGAYVDAEYVSYANAPQAPESMNTGATQDLSGVRLPNVSKFTYTLALNVAQPIDGGDAELYGRADFMHRSSFNASATNSIYSELPGYGVLNGRIGVRLAQGSFDLSVWARNLTNKNYYVARTAGTFGFITGNVGDPRTFGGTVRVRW